MRSRIRCASSVSCSKRCSSDGILPDRHGCCNAATAKSVTQTTQKWLTDGKISALMRSPYLKLMSDGAYQRRHCRIDYLASFGFQLRQLLAISSSAFRLAKLLVQRLRAKTMAFRCFHFDRYDVPRIQTAAPWLHPVCRCQADDRHHGRTRRLMTQHQRLLASACSLSFVSGSPISFLCTRQRVIPPA